MQKYCIPYITVSLKVENDLLIDIKTVERNMYTIEWVSKILEVFYGQKTKKSQPTVQNSKELHIMYTEYLITTTTQTSIAPFYDNHISQLLAFNFLF